METRCSMASFNWASYLLLNKGRLVRDRQDPGRSLALKIADRGTS